jgi:hypothetical protein
VANLTDNIYFGDDAGQQFVGSTGDGEISMEVAQHSFHEYQVNLHDK